MGKKKKILGAISSGLGSIAKAVGGMGGKDPIDEAVAEAPAIGGKPSLRGRLSEFSIMGKKKKNYKLGK